MHRAACRKTLSSPGIGAALSARYHRPVFEVGRAGMRVRFALAMMAAVVSSGAAAQDSVTVTVDASATGQIGRAHV